MHARNTDWTRPQQKTTKIRSTSTTVPTSPFNAATEPSTATASSSSMPSSPVKSTSAPNTGSEARVEVWNDSVIEGAKQLGKFAIALKNNQAAESEMERRKNAVDSFLDYLELQARPSAEEKAALERSFTLYSRDAKEEFRNAIPEPLRARVLAIRGQLQEDDEVTVPDSNIEAAEDASNPPPPTTTALVSTQQQGRRPSALINSSLGVSNVRLPPSDHPIWGQTGIMHGFVHVRGQRDSIRFNPELRSQQRSAKVFGHNNLTPGDWWPLQIVSVFNGAHGHNIQGICGTAEAGAWSIVCSGRSTYSELDRDEGDTLYYSADGSVSNTNPLAVTVVSNSTKALQKSLQTRRAVRVLRSAGNGKGHYYAPSVGIRYDGLYTVVEQAQVLNEKGGLYYRFRLQRIEGQESLDDIKARSPSREQIAQERRIKEWY
ncbi:E3 ubiquitin-protein ligase UHRF1 [Cladorrhinum samala]|uniref:E3 ubiquitin-protein ligase UHRF1 n=1 Tax=Cladorrhinum samala TaxID=585594 RepID=A0AAV9HQN6_9PEZI|nr:E3 ubiquitin-protein ligase UHRF1 [Cladorrhinum samala]